MASSTTPPALLPAPVLRHLAYPLQLPGPPGPLPGRHPTHLIDTGLYSQLVRLAFAAASGVFTSAPGATTAGLRARPPAGRPPDRAQRRPLKRHAGLAVRELPSPSSTAHYELYSRYQNARHAGGGTGQPRAIRPLSPAEPRRHPLSILKAARCAWSASSTSSTDSSVYTFFDPDVPGASFGTYNILWQAGQCAALGLPYLYLGCWIADSQKMAYKARFRPLEAWSTASGPPSTPTRPQPSPQTAPDPPVARTPRRPRQAGNRRGKSRHRGHRRPSSPTRRFLRATGTVGA